MKILVIARGIPSKQDPQWGCFEIDQAKALKALGHQVIVMSVDWRFRYYWRKPGIVYEDINGLDTFRIFWLPTTIIRRINYKLSQHIDKHFAEKLFNYIINRVWKPDIIHAHYLPCMLLGAHIKNKYQIPLVGTEHWSIFNEDTLPKYVYHMGNKTYKNVDFLITVSSSLKKRLLHFFGINSHIIHNMIGEEFVNSLPSNKPQNNNFVFTAVGSLVRVKGHDILINAFYKSKLKECGVIVKIIGDGPLKQELQKQIDELGLSYHIRLLGRKNKQDIISELKASDVFVQPSRAENFSVAVLEALSLGLPVVATICGGIRECINENNGILIPVEDVNAMADALCHIHQNINDYNRDYIVQHCINNFSPGVIAQKITEVYNQVASPKNK